MPGSTPWPRLKTWPERPAASGKLEGIPRPPAIGVYVELSLAMMQLLPAGWWDQVDLALARIHGGRILPTARFVWLGLTVLS